MFDTRKHFMFAAAVWALLALALFTQLPGCTLPLTVQAPDKALTQPQLMLANGYVTLTAQRVTVRQMTERGAIDAGQNAVLVSRLDAIRENLDLASVMINTPQGQDLVVIALQALLALEAELKAKEAK